MTLSLEYDLSVQRWVPASVAAFAMLLLVGLFAPACVAQINGAPASVTSPGFGGHAINGTAPSVTSVGPRGFAPSVPMGTTFVTSVPRGEHHEHNGNREHHRSHDFSGFSGLYAVPVVVPYDPNATDENADAEEDEADHQGGPTVFDRRGSGAQSYVPPVADVPVAHPTHLVDTADPEPETPQESTLLVFKDGHKAEVGNYAIVGQTLFDLTPGHPRKIALATLDLDATQKENDDRGVSFQLPPMSQAN
jgi:hypothetical protein